MKAESCEKLDLLIRSSQPIITCETVEEDRFRSLARYAAYSLQIPYFEWSVVGGFQVKNQPGVQADTSDPVDGLQFIRKFNGPAVFLLNDFTPHLNAPTVIRLFRETASSMANSNSSILLCSPRIELPPELSHLAVPFELKLPTAAELRTLLASVLEALSRTKQVRIEISSEDTKALISSLAGLTLRQARQALTYAIMDTGALNARDIQAVLQRKSELIQEGGLLEVYPRQAKLEIGGFKEVKQWLMTAQVAFSDEARQMNLPAPKGVLLVGVPGCGKSLCAKMIASLWQQPLIRLDASRLFDKFVGESERNFRRATGMAEAMAPCVFWIDELERTFASEGGGSADGGVSQRLFGAFLTWMQEKNDCVFLVATANDISKLPPELLRKGRFDEIFFVDLPAPQERAEIFAVQLKAHNLNPGEFDLQQLALVCDGFSGAEIEQLVTTSLLRGLRAKIKVSTQSLIDELRQFVPLSRSRPEEIEALRRLAKSRFRPAS